MKPGKILLVLDEIVVPNTVEAAEQFMERVSGYQNLKVPDSGNIPGGKFP